MITAFAHGETREQRAVSRPLRVVAPMKREVMQT